MAQEKYAYGQNSADTFADDDPLAELARIVGYDKPVARPETPEAYRAPAAPAQPAAPVRYREPAFDLEDELLKEFERYDTPRLDPTRSMAARAPEPVVHQARLAEQFAARNEPPMTAPVAAPVAMENAPAFDAYADLADELELSVSDGATDLDLRADAGLRSGRSVNEAETARREPSFEPESPRYVEQPMQAYDIDHFSSHAVEDAVEDAALSLADVTADRVATPVVETPAVARRAEPEFAAFDEALADDEFDLALDGLEIDLSDIVLSEVEAAVPAAAPAVAAKPAAHQEELFWGVPALSEARKIADDEELPFDVQQISDADFMPEMIADMDVPEIPVEAFEAPTAASTHNFDMDFEADLADLMRDEPQASASHYAQATPAAKVAVPEIDEFADFMNEDFSDELATPLGAERSASRPVIDPDNMSVVEPSRGWPMRTLLVGAVASVAVVAVGLGGYAWMTSGSIIGSRSSDGPPIIAADTGPIKVAPENPGGATVPNQDKAVYDRVAGAGASQPTQKSLITSSEEPLDVVQRTLTPENFPLDRAEDEADMADGADQRLQPDADAGKPAAATPEAADANVSLRKVKTMIVRPDGTLVARETEAETAPAQTAKATTPTAAALPASKTEAAATQTAPVKPEETASAQSSKAPVPVQRPSQQPTNVVGTVTSEGNVRQTAPAAQPPVQTAAVTPAAATPAAATPAAASKPLAAGTYVVQIASLPSEAEAQRSYKNMSTKFGGIISGRGVDIKSADIPGKGTFYRVRIPAGSKADADAMCGKLKAAGSSCIVTR